MDIKYSVQTLEFKMVANRYKRKLTETLLLKIDNQFYLNYHPWAEFGDISISDFLKHLKVSQSLPNFMKNNLKLEIERSRIEHKTFFNHEFGCSTYNLPIRKIKFLGCKKDLLKEIKNSKDKLRIDFNLGLKSDEFLKFWTSLDENLKGKIDFFEDPCELVNGIEGFEGIPIASDRFSYPNEIEKIKIFKPSIDTKPNSDNFIVSSYMGHDLGIYHTYLSLMRFGDLSKFHGIVTPPIYNISKNMFKFNGAAFEPDKNEIGELYKELDSIEWKSI